MVCGFLKWFLFTTLLLGLAFRFCGQDPCEWMDTCCGDHHSDAGDGSPGNPDHDSKCPPGHHHDVCMHSGPITHGDDLLAALSSPTACFLGVAHTHDRIPTDPVLEKDIPPII